MGSCFLFLPLCGLPSSVCLLSYTLPSCAGTSVAMDSGSHATATHRRRSLGCLTSHVCEHGCTCMWRSEVNLRGCCSDTFHLFFEAVSQQVAQRAGQRTPGLLPAVSQALGCKHTLPLTTYGVVCQSWNLNAKSTRVQQGLYQLSPLSCLF